MKVKIKRILVFTFVVTVIVLWSLLLQVYSPEQIVNYIGINQSYAVFFLISALGGASTFTSASFYSTLITLASGGLNIIVLGIIGGIAVSIGDSIFFYVGHRGKDVLEGKAKGCVKKMCLWLKKKPRWMVPVLTYFYVGWTPFPNDILMVTLGLLEIKYKKIVLALILGNVTLTTIVAYLSVFGVSVVKTLV